MNHSNVKLFVKGITNMTIININKRQFNLQELKVRFQITRMTNL